VDRYTLLRATSSTERQCATTINNKGGGEGVRERFLVLGEGAEQGGGTREGDTQIYLVYIEGDCAHMKERRSYLILILSDVLYSKKTIFLIE
jgi:hypothetical protein